MKRNLETPGILVHFRSDPIFSRLNSRLGGRQLWNETPGVKDEKSDVNSEPVHHPTIGLVSNHGSRLETSLPVGSVPTTVSSFTLPDDEIWCVSWEGYISNFRRVSYRNSPRKVIKGSHSPVAREEGEEMGSHLPTNKVCVFGSSCLKWLFSVILDF